MSRTATATAPKPAAKVLDFIKPDVAQSVGTELEQTSSALVKQMLVSTVTDIASCEQAVLDRQALGEAQKRVEEFFAPFKKMAYDLWKALCARENAVMAPIKALDTVKKHAISTWTAEQNRMREAEERRIADEQRRADDARAAAEAAALEAAGDHELARSVMEEQIAAPQPIVTLPTVKQQVAGLKTVRRWYWKYSGGPKDLKQTPPTLLARAQKLIPRDYLCADEVKIGAYVRSMKETAKIPGIDVFFVDEPVR
jgi:hypothetical protein